MRHFTLYFQKGTVVEMLKKDQRDAAEFTGSILYNANSFSMF